MKSTRYAYIENFVEWKNWKHILQYFNIDVGICLLKNVARKLQKLVLKPILANNVAGK